MVKMPNDNKIREAARKLHLERGALEDFFRDIPDEESAHAFMAGRRWPGGVACTACGSGAVNRMKAGNRSAIYSCRNCKERFGVLKNTSIQGTKISYRKLLLGVVVICNLKKRISYHNLCSMGMHAKSVATILRAMEELPWILPEGKDRDKALAMIAPIGGEYYIKVAGGGSVLRKWSRPLKPKSAPKAAMPFEIRPEVTAVQAEAAAAPTRDEQGDKGFMRALDSLFLGLCIAGAATAMFFGLTNLVAACLGLIAMRVLAEGLASMDRKSGG